MRRMKKLGSWLLTAAMLLSLLSTTALAEEHDHAPAPESEDCDHIPYWDGVTMDTIDHLLSCDCGGYIIV